MNGIRCPKCELVNLLTAPSCHRCGQSFKGLGSKAEVSVPVEETFEARMMAPQPPSEIPMDNELGRKTYFWYRVYCGLMVLIYGLVLVVGIIVAIVQPESDTSSAMENMVVGIVYAVLGAIFAVVFAIAFLLPRKPFNWVVGIVMIAIGMTSCCFLPGMIPLLIFWIKPETKAYFGRT